MIDDKRKNRRRHIKAASDWLIQAEKSIESKNDVQGDLKIMLAKAELQNAENHRNKTPFKKFLPLTVAAAIIFGIFWVKDVNQSEKESAKVAFKASEETIKEPEIAVDTLIEEKLTDDDILSEQEPIEMKYEPEVIEEDIEDVDTDERYELPQHENYENNFDVNEESKIDISTVEESNYIEKIAIPPENMQKLMQSAGQILRAE